MMPKTRSLNSHWPRALHQLVVVTGARPLILAALGIGIDFGEIGAGDSRIAIDLDHAGHGDEGQFGIGRHGAGPQFHHRVTSRYDAQLRIMRQIPMAVLRPQAGHQIAVGAIDRIGIAFHQFPDGDTVLQRTGIIAAHASLLDILASWDRLCALPPRPYS